MSCYVIAPLSFMSKFTRFLAAALASSVLAVSSASAALFNFSYSFDDGTVVTGSLSGNQNGQFIDNVAGVSFAINGVSFADPVFAFAYDSGTAGYVAGPVVSFDLALNNFAFATSDLGAGDTSHNYLFAILAGTTGVDLAAAVDNTSSVAVQESSDTPARWSLAAAPVPEAGSTLALAGLALLGLVAGRRFRR
jgi:hypothetical protein